MTRRLLAAVLDYDAGNVRSAKRGVEAAGVDAVITSDPVVAADADALVIPGVGHFGTCSRRLRERGAGTLYEGALATSAATVVGHYPWLATYNYLSAQFPPPPPGSDPLLELARNAGLGLCA